MPDPLRLIDGRLHMLLGDGHASPLLYGDPTRLNPGWSAPALYVGCDHLLWLSLQHDGGEQVDWFFTGTGIFLTARVDHLPGPMLASLLRHVRDVLEMPEPWRNEALDALGHMHPPTLEIIRSYLVAQDNQPAGPAGSELDLSPAPLTMPPQPGPLTPVAILAGAQLAQPGILRGTWRQDGDRIAVQAGHPVSITLPMPYRPMHARVRLEISGTDRPRRLTVTTGGWTVGTTRVGHEKVMGSRLDYWIPAEALDGQAVTIDLATPQESGAATAFLIGGIALDLGPAVPDVAPPADDAALMAMFESLGENCEFGFVQRHFGIEPLGLFRFSGAGDLRNTLRLLDTDFAGLGDAGSLSTISTNAVLYRPAEPPLVIPEFMMVDKKLEFWYHTFRGPEQDTEPAARALNEQKLRYLKRKFIEDLEDGTKIWVLKDSTRGDLNEAFAFLDVLSRRGPNRLLWVTRLVAGRPSGAVEWVAPNLLRGYSGGVHHDPQIFDAQTWKLLCSNAARAFAEQDARSRNR